MRCALLGAATAAVLVLANAPLLPVSAPVLRQLAGGEPILDTRRGYSGAEAYALLDRLGTMGRSRYLGMLWTIDVVLPAFAAASLWTVASTGGLRRARRIALVAAAADYAENIAVTVLVAAYPARHDGVAALASALTLGKSALYAVAIVVAAWGAWRAVRGAAQQVRP